jgi:cytosine/adenosine deaminase-related metal-dependent hydrolase
VLVTGLHVDQGYCVRFPPVDGVPLDDEDEALETWEDWDEIDFLAPEGTIERGGSLPSSVLSEAKEVLDDAEDGCHLHLHESDED